MNTATLQKLLLLLGLIYKSKCMPDEEDVDVEGWKDGHGEGEEEEEDVADAVVQLVTRRLSP